METVSEAQDDSSGANPSSVKSENGSPPPDGERASPPPNCAICLGKCRNKSFTDSCLHQFCFKCLVTWSKVKTVCPLCKQNFKSIIHNVQSNQQYEEYRVEQEEDRIDIDDLVTATRRFRYRTTLTFPRGGEQLAFHRLLMRYPPLSAMVDMSRELPGITPAALPSSRRRRSPSSFRRTVYRHNLWARPLPDFTGRHRDCTPEFYRYNDSQMHRLVPWLNRELTYLLLENSGHIAYVLQRILELLPQYHITSPEFREEMYRFFGSRTDHFLHELHCFASTPYDLTGYDRSVQYTTDSRVYINTVNDISSSDTDSGDSDVVEVLDAALNRQRSVEVLDATLDNQRSTPLAFRPVTPILTSPFTVGPSTTARSQEPVYPLNLITSPTEGNRPPQNSVIPIETISHSDTDDDEVMVTGYIRPPHQRTPEVVDLRDSDSDVVVTEPSPPPPPPPPAAQRFPVKLTLSRPRLASRSDSDDETYTPPQPPPPRIRRRRSSSDAVLSSRSSGSSHSYSSSTSSSSDDEIPQRNTVVQKKGKERARNRKSKVQSSMRKRKRSREVKRREVSSASTSGASSSATAGSSANDRSSPDREHQDMRLQRKSINGKGVKSSRRNELTIDSRRLEPMEADGSRPVPESRTGASDNSVRSRRDNSDIERELVRTKQSQVEPQPGPSSRPAERIMMSRRDEALELPKESMNNPGSSRSSSKVGKSSRRDESSQFKRAESKTVQEPQPEVSLAQIRKEIKQRRRDDGESMNINDEPQPGPSSRPDMKITSSRRDALKDLEGPSESRRAETRKDPEASSRLRSKGKTSRRDESIESPSGSSSRSNGQVALQDLPSETIGASSRSLQNELRPESYSRHGEKRVKLSKSDLSETRKHEPSTDESRSDEMRSSGKVSKSSRREESPESRASPADAQPGPSQAGPSNFKRKSTDEIPTRREHKRLKSVVKKASGSSTSVSIPSSVIQVSNASKKPPLSPDGFSDSDDDIPLNLTIQRSAGHSHSTRTFLSEVHKP